MTGNNYCEEGKCSQKKHKFTIHSQFINNHGNIMTFDGIANDGDKISIPKICDLLNELYEENEDLKQENKALQVKLHKIQIITKGY